MRILHIIDSGGLYGAETVLLHLMVEQVKTGLTPILASIGTPGEAQKPVEAEAQRLGLSVKAFRMFPGPNFFGARCILRFARREKIEILHTHGYKANILLGFIPKKYRYIPQVATLHGWTWIDGFNRMRLYEWLEGVSFRFIDRVILVNERQRHHPRLQKLNRRSFLVVENGIPTDQPPAKGTLRTEIVNFTRQGVTIGAIGRLSPEKGFDLLIDAFSDLVSDGHDFYLLILGEGPVRRELEQQISDMKLGNRVMLAGYVPNAANYLPLFALFAMPSLTEGLPMVLLEAMAARTPIAATRVGGIPDVLDGGKAGYLIDPDDREGLRTAILAIEQDDEVRCKKIENAEKRVREKYSSGVMAAKYENIYRSLIP